MFTEYAQPNAEPLTGYRQPNDITTMMAIYYLSRRSYIPDLWELLLPSQVGKIDFRLQVISP